VQAIGAGCGVTLGRAIAQDVYGRERLVKAIAYLTMFYTIGPMISPIVGGILIDAFGWRSVFGFALALGGVIALGAYFAVFETRPPTTDNRIGGNLLRDYAMLFGHLRFTAFVLQSGLMTGTFLATATAASTLLKDMLHRPSSEFGLYFLLFPVGFLAGNFVTSRIGVRIANVVCAGLLHHHGAGPVAVLRAVRRHGDQPQARRHRGRRRRLRAEFLRRRFRATLRPARRRHAGAADRDHRDHRAARARGRHAAVRDGAQETPGLG